MKRWVSVLLLFLLLLSGCAASEDDTDTPSVDVYYLAPEGDLSGGSALSKVTYTTAHPEDLLHEALVRMMEDPEGKTKMRSAFPAELHINTYQLENRDIRVDLSQAYLTLSPVQKTLVRCCLVLTLCSLSEVDSVSISVEGKLVEEGLNQDVLLMESTSENEYQTELELWFPAKDGSCLVSELRQLTIAQNKPLAEYAMEELLRGPQRSDANAAAPEGTELLGVEVSKGVCTVDLSSAFYANRPESPTIERLTVYALVNTLTELPGIQSVRITVNGNRLEEYSHIRLSQPLTWAEEFTYPCMVKWDWYIVKLYLLGADGKLVAVPIPADDQEYPNMLTMTSRAVEQLLSLEWCWGYELPTPHGTRLLGTEAEDRFCTLNLSHEFLSGSQRQRNLAARAIAATAIDAGNYQGVRIRVEGEYYEQGVLFRKEGDWFADG